MDRFGNGEELVLDNVFQAVDKKPSFQNFDRNLFAGMCILAGCDFLPSIHGIGIVKAHSFVSKYRNLERVLSVLKIEKGNLVSEDYSKSFMEAIAVFQHARVYDRDAKKLKYMKPLSKSLLDLPNGELDFLGPDLPPSVAAAIAVGNVDPISMEAFNHFPDSRSPLNPRVQSRERFQKQEKNSSLLHSLSENQRSEEDETWIDSRPVQNDIRCSKQDSELHKLISQPSDHLITATVDVHSNNPLKIPNNNPFKRRKAEQIQLEHKKSTTEELKVSFSAKDEELEVRFLVPRESMSLSQTTEDFCPKDMKESIAESIQMDISGIEQCSEVERETKGPEIADGIVEFQGRLMSSTTKRVRGVKGTSKNGKVKANCKGSENKKRSSILDFFHRL